MFLVDDEDEHNEDNYVSRDKDNKQHLIQDENTFDESEEVTQVNKNNFLETK